LRSSSIFFDLLGSLRCPTEVDGDEDHYERHHYGVEKLSEERACLREVLVEHFLYGRVPG
jgi:hypothetical protein